MKVTNFILSLTLMTSSLVMVFADTKGATFENCVLPHPINGDLIFTGTIGGHEATLTGDVQSIIKQAEALFPEFKADSLLNPTITKETNTCDKYGNIVCHPPPDNWQWAYRPTINDGINYLNGLSGSCEVGPTSCVRISCSYNAAIFLCNDTPKTIAPSCKYLATFASDICTDCYLNLPFSGGYCCGQEFDDNGFNIMVVYDRC